MKSIGISIFLYLVSSICLFGQWTDNQSINAIICNSKIKNIIKNTDSAYTYIKSEHFCGGGGKSTLNCVDNQGRDKWSINIKNSANGYSNSTLTNDGKGGIYIATNNYSNFFSNTLELNEGIFVQHINSEGKYLWDSKTIAVCNTHKRQLRPQIVGDGFGGAVVVWEDGRNIDINSDVLNKTFDIYAQRINSNGERRWGSDGVSICKVPSEQFQIQLLSVSEANTIIVWSDDRPKKYELDIYAQCIDTSGKVKWAADGIAVCDAANSQDSPQLISDNCGGCIIVWSDSRGENRDIYAQRLNNQGIPLWDKNGIIVCDAVNIQDEPQLVGDGNGGAVITWEDQREQYTDVYAQRINSDGKVQWKKNGVTICNALYIQNNPQIIKTGKDTFKIFWEDARFGRDDIFSQEINIDGTIKLFVNGEIICTGNYNEAYP